MNLRYYYWYFKKEIPLEFCNKIIKHGKSRKTIQARTGDFKKNESLSEKETSDLKKTRDSQVSFFSDQWIYDALLPLSGKANISAGWNFDIDWTEPMQFTEYGLNQHYDWHCDSWDRPYDDPKNSSRHNKIRKISTILSLNDSSQYEGGELEFSFHHQNPDLPQKRLICQEIKEPGSLVVFPSHLWHHVKPVIKGERYSLVMWSCGKSFK